MRLALALAILPGLPATAAVPDCYVEQEVAEAVTVIQIMEHAVERSSDGNRCRLTGTVMRSFRGDIAPGTPVQTSFHCGGGEGGGEPLVGGFNWNEVAVAAAAAVEIHAAAVGGIAGDGLVLLDAPTEEPAYRFEHPEGC